MDKIGDNWLLSEDYRRPPKGRHRLQVENHWSNELSRLVLRHNVMTLNLSCFDKASLRALTPIAERIRYLVISYSKTSDLGVVNAFENLEELHFSGSGEDLRTIDFTKLKKLKHLAADDKKLQGNYLECSWIECLNAGNIPLGKR